MNRLARVLIAGCACALTAACASGIKPVTALPTEKAAQLQAGKIAVSVVVPDVRETMPGILQTALKTNLAKCMTGSAPADISVRVDSYKEQNGAATLLVGDRIQLAGLVTFTDAQSGQVLGEYYVDETIGGGGLIGMAMMADAENNLSKGFSNKVCHEVFNWKG